MIEISTSLRQAIVIETPTVPDSKAVSRRALIVALRELETELDKHTELSDASQTLGDHIVCLPDDDLVSPWDQREKLLKFLRETLLSDIAAVEVLLSSAERLTAACKKATELVEAVRPVDADLQPAESMWAYVVQGTPKEVAAVESAIRKAVAQAAFDELTKQYEAAGGKFEDKEGRRTFIRADGEKVMSVAIPA